MRARRRRAREKDGTTNKKKCSSLGTRLSDPFQERPGVCARVCVLPPFHALSRSHHSLWEGGVLLRPVDLTDGAPVSRIDLKGLVEGGERGGWGVVVTDREIEDSIRRAISQPGTPVWRDRLRPSISLHYPQPQGH